MIKGKDIKNKGITINLDKERHIKFDLNAFCELEDRFGDIQIAFESLQKMSMKSIRTLLFVGLSHEDETLTEKTVGSLITMDNINNIADIISSVMSESMPEVEDMEETEEEKN